MIKKGDKVTVKSPGPKSWIEQLIAIFKKDEYLKFFKKDKIYEIESANGQSIWIKDDRGLKTYFKLPDPRIQNVE